ncbi:MAG: hypothetical protein JWM33_3995 [Caulobacteraceae bacterium]|nr:hypothetical protein [Caulobacteraceae bacterium]
MITILAAAAMALTSSNQAVSVRVNVHGMDRHAAVVAIKVAAKKVCRVVSVDSLPQDVCIQAATDDGVRQLDGLAAPVQVAAGG